MIRFSPSSKGNPMDQIEEFEQRITLALDKIAAHLEAVDPAADAQNDNSAFEALRDENERLKNQLRSLQSELAQAHADRDEETAQVQALYKKLADALNAPDREDA